MKNLFLFTLLLVSLYLCSCNFKSDEYGNTEPINQVYYDLEGEEILLEEFQAVSMTIVDTVLFVQLSGNKDYFYRLYNTHDLSLIGHFGNKGEGPKDWGGIRFGGQVIDKGTDKLLLMNDTQRFNVRLVNLTEFFINDTMIYEQEFLLHPKHGMTQEIFSLSENIFVGVPGIDAVNRGRMIFYNKELDESHKTKLFPEIEIPDEFNPYDLYVLYFSYLKKHPSKDLFASVMFRFDRLDIFDKEGDVLHSAQFDPDVSKILKEKIASKDADHLICYQDLKVTEERIYALYLDQYESEYNKKEKSLEIRVLDWNGDYLGTLRTSEYLLNIEVDEKNNCIYGIDHLNEKILRYDISEFLRDHDQQI